MNSTTVKNVEARVSASSGRKVTLTGVVLQPVTYVEDVRQNADFKVLTGAKSGASFLPFTMEVHDEQKTRNELRFTSDRYKVTLFSGPLDRIREHLTVGGKVTVSGYLEDRTYTDKRGVLRTSTELRGEAIYFVR